MSGSTHFLFTSGKIMIIACEQEAKRRSPQASASLPLTIFSTALKWAHYTDQNHVENQLMRKEQLLQFLLTSQIDSQHASHMSASGPD